MTLVIVRNLCVRTVWKRTYSILEDLQKNADDATKEMLTSIKTLIAVINAKDRYTFRHVERVVYYCSLVADKQNFSEKDKT